MVYTEYRERTALCPSLQETDRCILEKLQISTLGPEKDTILSSLSLSLSHNSRMDSLFLFLLCSTRVLFFYLLYNRTCKNFLNIWIYLDRTEIKIANINGSFEKDTPFFFLSFAIHEWTLFIHMYIYIYFFFSFIQQYTQNFLWIYFDIDADHVLCALSIYSLSTIHASKMDEFHDYRRIVSRIFAASRLRIFFFFPSFSSQSSVKKKRKGFH